MSAADEHVDAVGIALLDRDNAALLRNVADDVFDHAIDLRLVDEFVDDPRHHLAVAVDAAGQVVGMASGVHYVHPDKRPQLFINEVAVAPAHRRHGVGRRLVERLLAAGRTQGCTEAWVLTSPDNAPALAMYASAGGTPERERPVLFEFPLDRV